MPIWNEAIAKHLEPRLRRSIWQLVNTLIPYAALTSLAAWAAPRSYWITLVLAVPAGALLVRIFVLFHDCSPNAFTLLVVLSSPPESSGVLPSFGDVLETRENPSEGFLSRPTV